MGHSPFDSAEIGVTAQMAKVEGKPGQFRFAVHVDAPDVLFLKDGAGYHARLATGLVEYNSDGVKAIPDSLPVNLDLSEEAYTKAMTGGVEFIQQAGLDETIRQVRLVVLDRNSSLAGTVTMPIGRTP